MKLNGLSYLFFLFSWGLLVLGCTDNNSSGNNLKTNKINHDSTILKTEYNKLMSFLERDQLDSLKSHARTLYLLAKDKQNDYYLGKSNSILGYLNLLQKQEDLAYYYLNQAKDYFLKINDSINLAKNLTNMAIIQSNQGDFSGSEITAIEALRYLKNNQKITSEPSIYNSLAISSFARKNHDEAIYWYKKAIQTANDSINKKIYSNNLAVTYTHLGQYDKSIEILTDLFDDQTVASNYSLKAKVIDNLAFAQWKKNPDLNLENEFNRALKIRLDNHDERGMIANYSHLSEYFESKNGVLALSHAKKMYEISSKLKSPDDQLAALQKLMKLEIPDKSKEYALKYVQLNDSLVTSRNLVKDQFAKIRYDSERNREENKLLKAEKAVQELEIERRKLFGVILIGIIVLISGGALAWHRIEKVKNQKLINEEIHATEIKIAGKVHDNLSNNVYQLMSYIENYNDLNSSEKKNYILEKLEEVYHLSRNISRESTPIDTGEMYPEELLNLISSYKNEKTNIILSGFDYAPWKNVNKEVKFQFYKVLQELLTNMKKHSQASLVVFSFKFENNKLNFFYTDNGVGIPKEQFTAKNGIYITENRIEKINGKISFASNPSKGLKINISIPL